MNPEFIIKIIVRARNEIAGVLQKAAGDVDKLTDAHERGTKAERKRADASKATAASIDDATKRFKAYTQELENGNRSTEGAVKQLQSFRREFDRLGNRTKAGSDAADTLYKLGQQAEATAQKIKTAEAETARAVKARAREAERAAARERELGESRVATERAVRAEIAKTVRATRNARTEAERAANRDRLSGHTQALRDLGVPEEDVRKALKRAYTDQDTDVAISRRARRIDELTAASRRLRNVQPPQAGFLTRFFHVDEERLNAINQRIHEFEQSANKGGFSAVRLAGNLRGMVIVGAIAFFQQLVGIGVALGGTLVSVASAAIQAGSALGGALVAGAAQALPVIGLLGAAWGRVGAVFDVLKKQQQAHLLTAAQSTKQAGKQANAVDALASAQDGLVSAQDAVAESHRRVTEAQQQLTEARLQAGRQLEDLIAAEHQAQLQAESAALAQSAAQEQLRHSLATGSVDDLASQALEVRSTSADLLRSRVAAGRAAFDAQRRQRGGVEQMPDVVSARRALADANRGVVAANRGLVAARRGIEEAKRSATQAGDAVNSTTAMLNQMLAQLSPAERRLYGALKRVRDRYKEVFSGPGGILVPIINAFTHAANRVYALLNDNRLVQSAHRLSESIGKQLNRITDGLTSPKALRFFSDMANEARRNLPVFVDIVGNLAQFLMNIARAGSPALHAFLIFLRQITGQADKATGSSSGMRKLERFFMNGEKYAESIVHLTGAVGGLILALMGASASTGGNVIDKITEKTREATHWINTHQKDVRKFFHDAATAAGFVMHAVWALTKALFSLFHPDQVEAFSKAFEKTLLPVLLDVFQVMGLISKVFLDIASSDVGSVFLRLLLTTIGISKVIGPVISFFGRMAILLGTLTGRIELVRGGLMALRVATGPIGIAIGAIAATFLILSGRIHNVGDALKALIPIVGGLAFALIAKNGLGGALSMVGGLLGRLPGGLGRLLGRIGGDAAGAAGGAAASAGGTAAGGLLGRLRGGLKGGGALRGGLLGAGISLGGSLLGNAIGGNTGNAIGSTATGAGIGASIGSIVPGLGTGIGAGIGGAIGFLSSLGNGASAAESHLKAFRSQAGGLADEMRREGDWKGLRELARQADKIAQDSPGAADGLHKFAAGARDAAQQIKRLNEDAQSSVIVGTLRRELRQARAVTPKIVTDLLETLSKLPFGARKRTVQMIVAMVKELVARHQLPAAAGKLLVDALNHQTDRIVTHAKKAAQQYVDALTSAFTKAVPLVNAFSKLFDSITPKGDKPGDFIRKLARFSRADNTKDALRITKESQQRPSAPIPTRAPGAPIPHFGKNYGLRGGPGGTTGIPIPVDPGDVKKAWDNVNALTLDRLERLRKLTHSKNKDVRDEARKEYAKLRDDVNSRMRGTARDTSQTWDDIRNSSTKKVGKMSRNVAKSVASLSNSMADSFAVIKDNTNKALGSFGAKNLKFGVKKVTGALTDVASSIADNAMGDFHEARSRAGKLIRVVEGGHDEVVLTTDPKYKKRQQGLLAKYLTKAPHVIEGFARGGFTNAVGAHVDTPGERAIAADLGRMGRALGIMFSPAGPRSARRTPAENRAVDGSPTSNHLRGLAMDVAPDVIKTIAQGVLHRFGLNRPMPGGWTGPGGGAHDERNHIELLGAAAKGITGALSAITGGAISANAPHVGRLRLTGPAGMLKNLGQRGVDKIRTAANKYIDKKFGQSSGAGVLGGALADLGPGSNAAKMFAYFKGQGFTNQGAAAIIGNFVQESGLSPHANQPGGPGRGIAQWSEGERWSQLLEFARGHHANPETLSVQLGFVMAELTSSYRGVLRALRSSHNLSALVSLVAHDYEGAGIIGDRLSPARSVLGHFGRKYETGGDVPGGGPQAAILHGGEHVWTAAEVARAGGHGAMRMLRRLLGGGGQGGADGYATGGRVALVGDSLGVGVKRYLDHLLHGLVSNVVGGRSSTSGIAALREILRSRGHLSKLFFDLGTNDGSAAQLRRSIRTADRITGNAQVYIPLVHGPGAAAKNAVIRAMAKARDDISILHPGRGGIGPDGIHYSPAGYQRIARVFAAAAKRGTKSDGAYEEPTRHGQDVEGVRRQINRAQKIIDGLKSSTISKKFTDALSKSFRSLLREGGLFDQMSQAVTDLTDNLALNLKEATYKIDATGKVVKRLGTVGVADRTATNLRRVYTALNSELKQVNDSLDDVSERLKNRHLTARERNYLTGIKRNLTKRQRDVRGQIADNLEARYQAQEDRITTRTQRADDRATRGLAAVDIKNRALSLLGMDDPRHAAQQRNVVLSTQIDSLKNAAAIARKSGHGALANQIADQIADLQQQIADNVATGLQGAVDQANSKAQRSQSLLDIRGRFADLKERLGDFAGAFRDRGNILQTQGVNLRQQRASLQGLMQEAIKSGDLALAQGIGDQLADLDASIAENTDAIRANTVAARQAAIDHILSRGGFLGGVFGGLQGITEGLGALSGTTDTTTIKRLLGQVGTTLGQTGSGLADQLYSGFGIDLRGQSPSQIVQSLSGLNYDQIEAGMPEDTKAQFEGLINSIIENTGAQVSNTQALNNLTAPVAQSWASTAWQWFRNAVFNGAGGLLPRYSVPHMATGGDILSDGMIYAHAGEKIVAANIARGDAGTGDVFAPTIKNYEKTVDMNAEEIANKLEFRWRTRPKARGRR